MCSLQRQLWLHQNLISLSHVKHHRTVLVGGILFISFVSPQSTMLIVGAQLTRPHQASLEMLY